MSNNIEEFFIKFIFKDEEATKKIKKFTQEITKAKSAAKQHARVTTQSNRKVAQSNKKVADSYRSIEQARNTLRRKITQANNLDIDTKSFERSLRQARKLDTVKKRSLELDTIIQEKRMQESKEKESYNKDAMTALQKEQALEKKRRAGMEQLTYSANFDKLSESRQAAFRKEAREMIKNAKDTDELGSAKRRLNRELRHLAAASTQAQRKLLSLRTIQNGMTSSTRNMIHAYGSLFAIFAGVSSINRVGQQFEAMRSQMFAATGDTEIAAEQIQFLDKLTNRLGISLVDTSEAFAKLAVSAKDDMTFEQIQELFTGLTEFGTVMGVSKDKMKWAMMAVQQIQVGLPRAVMH